MRPNVKQFVQLLAETAVFPAPVVDIGSLRTEGQEDYADLRPYFTAGAYAGFDMRHGAGVDCVGTIHRLPLATASVGTVILLDTLEHVLEPLAAMEEVTRVLRPGGVVVMSSHMNFPIHAHPSDYWRFTPMMFDHLMRALASRYVLVQGNVENPHTVFGIGRKTSVETPTDDFHQAVRNARDAWNDESFGGCLFPADPLVMDVEQRVADGQLPMLSAGRTISQTFVAARDGLARIDILMARPAGPSMRHLLFTVRDDHGDDIAAMRLLALQVVDGEWLTVDLAPQPSSAGRTYELVVTCPDGDADLVVSMKSSKQAIDIGGPLQVDGEDVGGTLCFKTFFRPATGTALDPWSQSGEAHGVARDTDPQEEIWHRARMQAAIDSAAADNAAAELRALKSAESAARVEPASVWARIRGKGSPRK